MKCGAAHAENAPGLKGRFGPSAVRPGHRNSHAWRRHQPGYRDCAPGLLLPLGHPGADRMRSNPGGDTNPYRPTSAGVHWIVVGPAKGLPRLLPFPSKRPPSIPMITRLSGIRESRRSAAAKDTGDANERIGSKSGKDGKSGKQGGTGRKWPKVDESTRKWAWVR